MVNCHHLQLLSKIKPKWNYLHSKLSSCTFTKKKSKLKLNKNEVSYIVNYHHLHLLSKLK